MKFMYSLILMLVGMAICGEWQKPASNLTGIKKAIATKSLTVDMIQKCDRFRYTPIMVAAYMNDNKAISGLLASGLYTANDLAQVNDFKESAIMLLNPTNLEGLKMLLATGKYDTKMLTQEDQDGNQLIHYAINSRSIEATKMILNAGKFTPDDLEKTNINKQSAISYAEKAGGKMATLMDDAMIQTHKNTLVETRIVQSSIPMLKRGN